MAHNVVEKPRHIQTTTPTTTPRLMHTLAQRAATSTRGVLGLRHQAIIGLMAALIFSLLYSATAQAAFGTTSATITSPTPANLFPDVTLTVDMDVALTGSTEWRGTEYNFTSASGPWECINTDNSDNDDNPQTFSLNVQVPAPSTTGAKTLYIRPHSDSQCDSDGSPGDTVSIPFTVVGGEYISTSVKVYGDNPYTAVPSESLQVEVTNTRNVKNWRRTSYRFDSGSWTCVDTTNHDDDGTDTVTFSVNAPAGVGAHTLEVKVHPDTGSCPDIFAPNNTASMTVNVSNATEQFLSTTAVINGATSYSAFTGEQIALTATNARLGTNWQSTSYRFGDSGGYTCRNTPNHNDNSTDSETFFITAPGSSGTYNLYVQAHSDDSCGGTTSTIASPLVVTVTSGSPQTNYPNPNLVPNCGLNFILVLDESYSIVQAGAVDDVRDASIAFLDGLKNTGANVAIVKFSTTAQIAFDYTLLDDANFAIMEAYINNVYSPATVVGYTNWDDAFNKVESLNAGTLSPLVVFITDGDPTTYGDGTDINTSDQGAAYVTDLERMTHPVQGSIHVKQQGSHIIAVGVGTGLNSSFSLQRLKDISGPDVYTTGDPTLNLTTVDVIRVTNFSLLDSALGTIVTALCAPSVNITKLVDPGTGVYSAAPGWTFSGFARYPEGSNGSNFDWEQPQATTDGNATVSGVTDANGSVNFQWDLNGLTGNSKIAITETLQSGYAMEDVECDLNSGSGTPVVTESLATSSFNITGIANDAVVNCIVKNKFVANPQITLEKKATESSYDAIGDVIHYTLVATNTGNIILNNVLITDTKLGTLSCTPALGSSLAVNASMSCTGSYTVVAGDIPAKQVNNTAHTSGQPPIGPIVTDEDSETVPLAALNMTKKATQSSFDEVGDVINYTLVVTNTGNATLTGVTINDPKLGALVCTPSQPSTLAPDATMSCTGSYTIQQADINAGKVDNTGTADSNQTGSDTDDETVPLAALNITKKATQSNFDEVGDVIDYTLIVTNTGNIALTGVTITDPKLGTLVCTPSQPSTLAIGAAMSCTGDYTVTQADLDAGKVDNTGTADSNQTGPDTDDETVPALQSPQITLNKEATEANFDAADDTIHYTLVATNTGNVTLNNVQISDPDVAVLTCVPSLGSTLAPGATMSCSGSYTVSQDDVDHGHFDNTATATGTPPTGPNVNDTDDETVPAVQDPALVLNKEAVEENYDEPGDVISYTLVATNTGNVTLHNVTISDPKLGTLECVPTQPATLAPGAILTCAGDYVVTQSDVDAGKVDNEATADSDETDPDKDDETVPAIQDPEITLNKEAVQPNYNEVGDVISYTLVATNTSNVTLSDVTITDPKITVLTCTPSQPTTLLPGATIPCTGSYTVTQADLDHGHFDNEATATGKDPQNTTVSDKDDETVPAVQEPEITLTKDAEQSYFNEAGDVITYTLVGENTGNVTLSNVQVSDLMLGALATCTPVLGSTLAPGETITCTDSYTVVADDVTAKDVDNTATATGTPPTGPDVDDTDDETVPLAALNITKKATQTSFDEVGDVIDYTLIVTNTGNIQLTGVTISDAKLGTLVCTPTQPATLAIGASMTCTGSYTTDQDDLDEGEVINTATADSNESGPDNDTETVDAIKDAEITLIKEAVQENYNEVGDVISYTLIATNTGNLTLTDVKITDPKITVLSCTPSQPTTLLPGEGITCTGSYTVTLADLNVGQVDNTATATGTPPTGPDVDDTDDETVPAIQEPEITLNKEAAQPNYNEVGDVISYTLVATNTGNVTLTDVKITDPKITVLSCTPSQPTTLLPGAILSCTGSYTVTQADLDLGRFDNEATVTGKDPDDKDVSDKDDETVPGEQDSALVLNKEAVQENYNEPGDVISYTLVATNTGNVTLHNVSINDPKLGTLVCVPSQPATLAPGAILTCEGGYTVTQGDLNTGKVDNEATADSDETEPTKDDETVPGEQDPALVLNKEAEQSSYDESGDVISYTLVATNTGNVTLHNVTISDPKLGSLECVPSQPATLLPDATISCTGSYTVTQSDVDAGEVVNQATADSDETEPDDDTETVPGIQNPALDIDKTGTEGPVTIGDTVFYTITVENVGNVTLYDVIITDDKLELEKNVGTLSVGQTAQITATYGPVTEDDLPGPIFNTAGATGTTPDEEPTEPVTDTHEVPVDFTPALTIDKTGTEGPVTINDTVFYTITVQNTGNVTLTNVTITDEKLGLVKNVGTLRVGDTAVVTDTYGPVTEQDLPGPIFNTAGVTGTTPTDEPTKPVTDTHEVPVTINPVLTLVKTATPTTFTVVGQTITYSYLLTNDGNVTLKAPFTVADDKTTVTCPDQPTTLAVGESITCTATYIITQGDYTTGSVTNVAQATAKDPNNDDVLSNEDEETVTREDLPVTVAGRVWYDDNANGVQDENEPNVENVKVNLLAGDCTTSLNKSTTTDSNGNYAFNDLTPGSYCVEFVSSTLPTDYKLTEQNVGDDDTVDSDPDPLTGKTTSITLASGASNETTDAGIVLKSLLITANPVCIDDAPYLEYSITPVNLTPGENPVTIRWIDVDNDAVLYELTNQPLNATLLWPEAGVDGNGVGNQWPGWSFVNDSWVDNGSNLRPQVKVEFEVNPTEAALVTYPPSTPFCATAPRGTIGDTVWNDANNNGLQDNGEPGIPGVKVDLYKADGTLVTTTTTDADGQYEFTGIIKGDYYLEFTTPAGYNFTRYQVNGNSQDGADSNAQAPTILLSVTDGDEEGEFDQNMTYTLNYTNTDAARSASNVVITTTVPTGTSFVAADSTTGWSCTDVVEGSVCTFTIPTLAANSSGNINFVVKLKGEDQAELVPDALDLIVHLSQSNVARTETITLPDGATNRTVDAGLVRTEASEQTPTPTDPTSLPGGEQPKQRMDLFLPALRLSEAPAESSSTPQVEEAQPEAQQQAISTYLPTVETQE